MTLTKESLIEAIYGNAGFSKSKSIELLESVLEIIKSNLESGEEIMISGFGKFSVKEKNDRRGRDPVTGDDLMLDARRVVRFKCSRALKQKLNRKD